MFTQPVSMPCTYDQYINDLKEPLLAMGYKGRFYPNELETYIVTNYADINGLIDCTVESNVLTWNRYYIHHYNPQLFLALASLTDDTEYKIGDWCMILEKAFSNLVVGQIYQLDSIKHDLYHFDPDRKGNLRHDGWFIKGEFRKATAQEIISHFTNNTMNRFPFKLSQADARRIYNIACLAWRDKLTTQWAENLLANGYVIITADFYKTMRAACTKEQHLLFDEIFGADQLVPKFKVGDYVIGTAFTTSCVYKITKVDINSLKYNVVRIYEGAEKEPYEFAEKEIQLATQGQINKTMCPIKIGQLVAVSDDKEVWNLRYFVEYLSDKNYPYSVRFNKTSDLLNERIIQFKYCVALPDDFELPTK